MAVPENPNRPLPVGLIAALVALLLVLPGPASMVFDGLPLSDPFEAMALLIVVVVAIPSVRTGIAEVAGPPARLVSLLMCSVIAACLVAKLALLLLDPGGGFKACYRPTEIETGSCAASYEDPWNLSDGTRLERSVAFESPGEEPPTGLSDSNWNLGFMNDSRMNYYLPEEPSRDRLGFEVRWEADVSGSAPISLSFAYVGEAEVSVDGTPDELQDSYSEPAEVPIELGPDAETLTITYRWDDQATAADQSTDPYAFARLTDDSGDAFTVPPSPRPLIAAADLLIIGLLAALAALVVYSMLSVVWAVGAVVIVSTLAVARPDAMVLPLGVWLTVAAVVWAAALVLPLKISRGHVVVLGFIAVVALVIARELEEIGSLGAVIYRGGGQDFLTYEDDARSILSTGSLRGGDDVFVYSPAFRYVVFLLHGIFGEGDALSSGLVIASLILGAVFITSGLVGRIGLPSAVTERLRPLLAVAPRSKKKRIEEQAKPDSLLAIPAAIVGAALVAMCASDAVADMIRSPLSEGVTWVVLVTSFALMFLAERPGAWLVGGALLGLASATRSEQLPAIVVLLVAFVLYRLRAEREQGSVWSVLAPVAAALVVAVLPGVHNLYYGDQLAFLPQTPSLPVNFPLPLSDLPSAFSDAEIRSTLISQVKGVLYVEADPLIDPATFRSSILPVAVHFGQLAWIFVVVLAFRAWSRLRWADRLLLALPAAYLLPHVFIQVYVYYPRHIIAGYLAMLIASLWVLTRLAEIWKEQKARRGRLKAR